MNGQLRFRSVVFTGYTFGATGNNAANTGKYTVTTKPLNAGVTFRFDY